MEFRVVSLPAVSSRMKNEASSAGGQGLPVDVGGDQGGGQVVGGVVEPVGAELVSSGR